jgi:hypothetical protein
MTREMQDGINSDAAGMDHSIALVAYYIDGPFAWTADEIAMFPNSVHVRIATRWTTRDGHVIDRENGDATAAQAAAWAHQRRLDGFLWPVAYCSESNQAEVIAAFNTIHEPLPLWWLAHWDNLDVLPPGAIAKQYADPGPLDRSVVADHWPGVDQGGSMTNPIEQNLAAFVFGGGPSTDAAVPGRMPQGVSDTSLFGRMVESQGMLQRLTDPKTGVLAVLAGVATQDATDHAAELAAMDADMKATVAQLTVAIQTEGAPQVTQAQLDAAFAAANIGPATAAALVALLAKAAAPASAAPVGPQTQSPAGRV